MLKYLAFILPPLTQASPGYSTERVGLRKVQKANVGSAAAVCVCVHPCPALRAACSVRARGSAPFAAGKGFFLELGARSLERFKLCCCGSLRGVGVLGTERGARTLQSLASEHQVEQNGAVFGICYAREPGPLAALPGLDKDRENGLWVRPRA